MSSPSSRPIRIGNASGAIGDGIDQVYRLAKSGAVDAITADYLAEFNIAWKAIERQTQPHLGYEPNFLEQLAWHDGDAARVVAEKKIKIVHNGGALNPKSLGAKVEEYFKSLGINHMKIAVVTGDDVTQELRAGELGAVHHLDRPGVHLDIDTEEILAANIYTGQAGILRALELGADIVICGRCCDASPVMALASWWHGWTAPLEKEGSSTDYYNCLARSLMAGHLIECGAYVTGGNFCGAREIPQLHHVGYPIAEISSDGTPTITKPPGTNGAVTIDTCKAQLLYEIQGTRYLNADVIADISQALLTEEDVSSSSSADRVILSGITGLPPPPTAKLAICLLGGWQAEISAFCCGLDTEHKFSLLRDQIMREIDDNESEGGGEEEKKFTTFSIDRYGHGGSSPSNRNNNVDPESQAECTVHFRLFAQAKTKEALLETFRRAVFYNGMQGYCGLHLSMDWRTMEPRPYIRYFPSLVGQEKVRLRVEFVGGGGDDEEDAGKGKGKEAEEVRPRYREFSGKEALVQESYDAPPPPSPSTLRRDGLDEVVRPLGDIAFGRSGDKGGNANVGLWVRDGDAWPWLRSFLSMQRLVELLGKDWKERYVVERCEFPNLWAVHFVVKGILQDGVSSSSILDGFAKSFGEFIRARHVMIPRQLVEKEDARRRDREALQLRSSRL